VPRRGRRRMCLRRSFPKGPRIAHPSPRQQTSAAGKANALPSLRHPAPLSTKTRRPVHPITRHQMERGLPPPSWPGSVRPSTACGAYERRGWSSRRLQSGHDVRTGRASSILSTGFRISHDVAKFLALS
jgi:hypothetical protein